MPSAARRPSRRPARLAVGLAALVLLLLATLGSYAAGLSVLARALDAGPPVQEGLASFR